MDMCPRCNSCLELVMHMLRDCEDVHKFWSKVLNSSQWSKFFSLGLHAWLNWNLTSSNIGVSSWSWTIMFGVVVWALWRDRNSLVFSQVSQMGDDLWAFINNQVHFIEKSISHPMASLDLHLKSAVASWKKPPQGVVKLNVIGSYGHGNRNSACSGLLRDENGSFIRVFFFFLQGHFPPCSLGRNVGSPIWP